MMPLQDTVHEIAWGTDTRAPGPALHQRVPRSISTHTTYCVNYAKTSHSEDAAPVPTRPCAMSSVPARTAPAYACMCASCLWARRYVGVQDCAMMRKPHKYARNRAKSPKSDQNRTWGHGQHPHPPRSEISGPDRRFSPLFPRPIAPSFFIDTLQYLFLSVPY